MPAHEAEVVCLDSDWAKIAAQSTSNPKSGATPEDLVYVIFTSGSTGRPKGVQVPHRAVVNLLTFMAQELRMGPDDVFPALASFAFDMCIPELYLALVTGGRVVIGDRHLAANGEELAALLRTTGATIVHATPTTWSLLLEAGFTGKGLKRVIGAEALAARAVHAPARGRQLRSTTSTGRPRPRSGRRSITSARRMSRSWSDVRWPTRRFTSSTRSCSRRRWECRGRSTLAATA